MSNQGSEAGVRAGQLAMRVVMGLLVLNIVARPSDQIRLEPIAKWPEHARNVNAAIRVAGNYAYIAANEGGLQILDVRSPAQLRRVGECITPGVAQDVAVSGNYACLASGAGGVQIIDVSDPAKPVHLSTHASPFWAYGVAAAGDFAYVAYMQGKLEVVDVRDRSRPRSLALLDTRGSAQAVVIDGPYAYLANGNAGLQVIDVRDPNHPFIAGSYPVSGSSWICSLAVLGGFAYLADEVSTLKVVDVTNPQAPIGVTSVFNVYGCRGVTAVGNSVYAAADSSGLHVIDVTDPTHPKRLGTYATGWAKSVAISGQYACLVDMLKANLEMVDISNPRQPVLAGREDIQGESSDVAVQGRYAYLSDGIGGLRVFDVQDPSHPVQVGHGGVEGGTGRVLFQGGFSYVARRGFQIFDAQDPLNLRWLSGLGTSIYGTSGFGVLGDYAYVMHGNGDLWVVDMHDRSRPYVVKGIAALESTKAL